MVRPNSTPSQVGSVPFIATRLDDAVAWTLNAASTATVEGLALRFANAYSVATAHRDARYAELLQGGGMNFPDGAPVAWALRRLGRSDARRVRGPSFFAATLRRSAGTGIRHYFFGTNEVVLARLVESVRRQFPGVEIAGTLAPDFRNDPVELAAQLPSNVTSQTVDILWVGLGSPKQDFVADIIARDRGLVVAGVGAAFDFEAGTAPQAPRFMRDCGLEWLFRLLSEPRRLWRRYLIGNVVFVRVLLRQLAGLLRARLERSLRRVLIRMETFDLRSRRPGHVARTYSYEELAPPVRSLQRERI